MKALINVTLSCTKPSQKRPCLRMTGTRYWRSHLKCHISWRTCASAAGLQLVSLLDLELNIFWPYSRSIFESLRVPWVVSALGATCNEVDLGCFIQILPTRDWKSTASQLKCSDSNQPYVRLTGIVIVTKIHHFWSSSPVVVTDADEEIQSRVSWLKMLCSYVVPAKASKIWGCECFTRMCPAEIFFMKQALPVAVGKTLECFSVCKLQGNLQWYRICADLTWLVEYLLGC